MNICTELYSVRVGKSRVFDRDLTKSMPCIQLRENRGVVGVRQGSDLKYTLRCIIHFSVDLYARLFVLKKVCLYSKFL